MRRLRDAPDEWTIIANGARDDRWPAYPGGMAEFLVAVLSGDPRLDVLPDDFPYPDARRIYRLYIT